MRKVLDIFSKRKIADEKLKIEVDHREKNSLVVSELVKLGFEISWAQLPVADYIVNGVAIERKTISDLKSSVIDKRIISQLLELKQYERKFLLVEGILKEDLYNSGMHENAFRGFLLSVALDFEVPIIFTTTRKIRQNIFLFLRGKKRRDCRELGLRKFCFRKRSKFSLF